ncbi:uncharacterized protein LOC119461860 isoform X1 [Dermacentor silvarum]|uniref:uncharacterized protein LOC119461860 isoform X1 n=1 Tax=Dermacentor silvarum TaxID=543639 RepID=UPI002100C619|nr:uncharacterized protein LOC119461860 isoform X1 [Dermacentor silvarum]XP_049523258.1 uncharacterized protein LOC119461860 isoform X1 [Dermacentor silvarum]
MMDSCTPLWQVPRSYNTQGSAINDDTMMDSCTPLWQVPWSYNTQGSAMLTFASAEDRIVTSNPKTATPGLKHSRHMQISCSLLAASTATKRSSPIGLVATPPLCQAAPLRIPNG